ncbi:MAG: RNA polymerase factor sigma-32 [Alphaproteobacteria bacterium]|nr:RNA polymerase factor sigma-32 [Alphaproteobacteria bacterium]
MTKQIKNALVTKSGTGVPVPTYGEDASLAGYIRTIAEFPILSAEQEYEYASKWVNEHDETAAEKLLESHLRLVVSVAYDFRNYGIPVGELVASGNMGLMQALQKFDPERGFRFSTYAMFWIRAEIYETILNNWSIVKIGTSANQKRVFFNLARAKRALGIMDGNLSDAQADKIAAYLDVPAEDVKRMSTRIVARDLSLNAPARTTEQDGADMLSNMADTGDSIVDNVERHEMMVRGGALLKKHLATLPERDREILRARRLQEPAATLEVLAKKYKISRERVRQIEEHAYNKLRDAILAETTGNTNDK